MQTRSAESTMTPSSLIPSLGLEPDSSSAIVSSLDNFAIAGEMRSSVNGMIKAIIRRRLLLSRREGDKSVRDNLGNRHWNLLCPECGNVFEVVRAGDW